MRWFKHMAASWDDEKLAALVDSCGLEGYGFWWRVVEVVAAKVDKFEQTSAEFPPKKWGSLLGISPKKFRMLAELCANLGLFSIKISEKSINITMPNILKFRDEYTEKESRKSGQTREKLQPSRARVLDTDTDTEKEIDKREDTASATPDAEPFPLFAAGKEELCSVGDDQNFAVPLAPALDAQSNTGAAPPPDEPHYLTRSGRYLAGKRLASFELFWTAFDLRKGKTEAADTWLDIPQLTAGLVAHICHAARCEAQERPSLEAKGQTPKWAQGWLEGRRWEDYPPLQEKAPQKSKNTLAADMPAHERPPLTPEAQEAARKKREEIVRMRNAQRGLPQEGAA